MAGPGGAPNALPSGNAPGGMPGQVPAAGGVPNALPFNKFLQPISDCEDSINDLIDQVTTTISSLVKQIEISLNEFGFEHFGQFCLQKSSCFGIQNLVRYQCGMIWSFEFVFFF